MEETSRAAEAVERAARAPLDAFEAQAARAVRLLRQQVEERPLATLGAAAGIGFVIGLLLTAAGPRR